MGFGEIWRNLSPLLKPYPALAFRGWLDLVGRGRGVGVGESALAYNSTIIHGIEMKIFRAVENPHKLINLV